MLFVVAVIVTCLITVPGMYLIARSRLGTSMIEIVSAGFFLGFGVVVIAYLSLSRCLPVVICDWLLVVASIAAVPLLISELRKQKLPVWTLPPDRLQVGLVLLFTGFMLVFAFGELAHQIDDDIVIHLPNIKRIALGDVPPHLAYSPDILLRGHTGRDVFTGTVARLVGLRPELAIIYVTLAVCPFYVLMFHALSWRLAGSDSLLTRYGLFGLLFLVSCSLGTSEIRAGALTYVLNNNAFAYSYAGFIGWLICRLAGTFAGALSTNPLPALWRYRLPLAICVIAYTCLYHIYISNFLMFSIFIVSLPLFYAVALPGRRLAAFANALAVTGVVLAGSLLLQVLVSPLVFERVLISLNLYQPSEPLYLIQQAQLTFPKEQPWTIYDGNRRDVFFFDMAVLAGQGPSFYIGLSGLIVGLVVRRPAIAAVSLFGWLTMLWLLLVDMGIYRGEFLRLFLVSHIAFGGATGLVIGLGVRALLFRLRGQTGGGFLLFTPAGLARAATVLVSIVAVVWMARGTGEKFMRAGHWNLKASVQKMRSIHQADPETWHRELSMHRIDYDVFNVLARLCKGSSARLLLKLAPDDRQSDANSVIRYVSHMANAAVMTGAGIVGVTEERHLPVCLCPFDYRASLLWKRPSEDLLRQLSPDWIVVDPTKVSKDVLVRLADIPGVKLERTFEDDCGRRRVILSYQRPEKYQAPASGVKSMTAGSTALLRTQRFGLVQLPVEIEHGTAGDGAQVKLGMLVLDSNGQPTNSVDVPIVSVEHLERSRYNLYFSMIRPGLWQVYFVDPATGNRLHGKPVQVSVSPSMCI